MKLFKLSLYGLIALIMNSVVKWSNNGMDYLFPEFWAQSFEGILLGEYNLQNLVSRNFEKTIANYGQKINVPLAMDFSDADSWTPGGTITATGITQTEAEVSLDKSYKKTINLTAKDLSLSPYDLIQSYGEPMAKSILLTTNKLIYIEALKSKYFVNAMAGISEDLIVSAGTLLSNNEVPLIGRKCVAGADVMGALSKIDAFQSVSTSGDDDVMKDGRVTRRLGFDFYLNNAIAKYTPADVAGAVNYASGYAAGATSMVVDAFNDDSNPIRPGDIFHLGSGTDYYTVTGVTTTADDTTAITFYPGLKESTVADNVVINIDATQSALCFVPSAIALAARSYGVLPEGTGVKSSISDFKGLPIRWSVWHDGNLGLNVQCDILFGVKLVHEKRLVRIVEDL
jgi:hypothetical protein